MTLRSKINRIGNEAEHNGKQNDAPKDEDQGSCPKSAFHQAMNPLAVHLPDDNINAAQNRNEVGHRFTD